MILYLLFGWAAFYALWLAYADRHCSPDAQPAATADPLTTTPANESGPPVVVEWTALDEYQLTRLLQQAAS